MSETLSAGELFTVRKYAKGANPAAPLPAALERLRVRRVERDVRRADAVHQRLADRMGHLGEYWRVLDLKQATGAEQTSFLAVGPSGIYAVTVRDHGRARVHFAGDVVQIDGKRPQYVTEARRNAQRAADALSRQAEVSVPVMPVLAFAGNGTIIYYGLPKGCIVTAYQDLPRVLNARGRRMAQTTVEKVFTLAVQPETWVNAPYVAWSDRYRWYKDGEASDPSGADK